MRGVSSFPMIIAILVFHWFIASAASQFADDLMAIETECSGSIAECSLSGEFEMDSEINRRMLAARRYISYGALRRNSVPCSRRGASYYNCRRGAQANPYSRGCTTITRCRR